MLIKKLDAADYQLKTAVRLFFEENDPVSVHTLACAALAILHDHIPAEEVWKHNIILHYNTVYIKDEGRKIWAEKTKEAANFFKHADRDLKAGNDELKFNSELTAFHIFEAINCLEILKGKAATNEMEYLVFQTWFLQNYPQLLQEEGKALLPQGFYEFPATKELSKEALQYLEANPQLVANIKKSRAG